MQAMQNQHDNAEPVVEMRAWAKAVAAVLGFLVDVLGVAIVARAAAPRLVFVPPHGPFVIELVVSAVDLGLYALLSLAIYAVFVLIGLKRPESLV